MEAIKLGLLLLALGVAEAAEAPQVQVESKYLHRVRLDLKVTGPPGLQPVMAAVAGIAVHAFEKPGFEMVDPQYLPQPGEYFVELGLVLIPDLRSLDPRFEIGASWMVHYWCDRGEKHLIVTSPLIQRRAEPSNFLPVAGALVKEGAALILAGILNIDKRFIERIERTKTET